MLRTTAPEMCIRDRALTYYRDLAANTMPGSNDIMEVKDAFMNGTAPMAIYSTYILPAVIKEGDPKNVGFVVPTEKNSAVYGMLTSLTITDVYKRQGFHGRTYMTMALTGKVAPYKIGFGPFPGSVYHVPYPSDLHGISTQDSLDAIERLFKSDIEAKQVAAIIFEPVQGEGGFNVAPKELVAAIRRLCDEHGIVMIADEVQSGVARTGKPVSYTQLRSRGSCCR